MLIGGLIVGGSSQFVVRVLGPSLRAVGVAGALQEHVLEIHNPDESVLASDDDWKESQETDTTGVRLAGVYNLDSPNAFQGDRPSSMG